MELSIDPETARKDCLGRACGVLNFIALVVWLRWVGTPEDQREVTPPGVPKRKEENAN